MEDLETTIMELLVNAGAARSAALTALQMARKGEIDEAEKAMEESREYVKHAHILSRRSLLVLTKGPGNCRLTTYHRSFSGPPDERDGYSGSGGRYD